MKTCFAIMPFDAGFDEIDTIVAEAASECGLEYVRGDRRHLPGRIMPQVLADIRHATVIVADITGHNPNVFYELAIAHQVKGPDRVVILAQARTVQHYPYDVHEFRQLNYSHNAAGRAELRKKLPEFLRAAAQSADQDHEVWNVVRGRLPRTRLLVRDLRRLIESAGPDGLQDVTIRAAAGLGSIAISDHEPPDPGLDEEYLDALREERNALRDVLLRGAHLRAVLNPPRRFAQAMLPERLRARYRRLIGLLEGRSDIIDDADAAAADLRAIARCHLVLSPVPMPNLFILGDKVGYEGMKRGGTGGLEMTHCETTADGLRSLIEQFDRFFEGSRLEMVRAYPPDGRLLEQLRGFYEEASRGSDPALASNPA